MLQLNVDYDAILLPKTVKFHDIGKSGAGFRSNKTFFINKMQVLKETVFNCDVIITAQICCHSPRGSNQSCQVS